VESGGYIDVNGRGYSSQQGPAKGADAYSSGGGAGHGGNGGKGYEGNGGGTYDSVANPSQIGSGGGRMTRHGRAGGNGGGGIRLSVGGVLTNNGTIRANGNNSSMYNGRSSGGGSGGFINLTAGEFTGSGAISANGGSAVSTTYTGGGGAGGRIALYYSAKHPAESYNIANISIAGGTGRNHGQNGTLYISEIGNPVITTNNGVDFATDIAELTLEGTCLADADWILINGSADGVDHTPGDFNWSYTLTLREGVNVFEVVAKDGLGNLSGTAAITVILDTTPAGAPVITTNTGGDFTVRNHIVAFQGNCSSDTVQILVNGSSSGVTYTPGSTTWSYEGELSVGGNPFSVVAIDGAGNESPADTITVNFENQIPEQPTNQSPADGGIDLARQAVLTASAFSDQDSDDHNSSQWQIRAAGGAYDSPLFDSGEDNQHLTQLAVADGILEWATQYFWRVRYRDSRGSWSVFSAETSFTTISDNEPPEDIVNLRATESTATGLTFGWEHSADTAGDLVYYKVYFNGDLQGSLLAPDQSVYFVTDLTPATGYTFKVTALDDSGNESEGVSIDAATVLENPLNLVAKAGGTWIDLTWDPAAPADLVGNYFVYQNSADFTSVEGLTPQAVSDTAASMTGLTPGVIYYFAVTTVNISGGEKTDITAISATPRRRMVAHYTMDSIDGATLVDETGDHPGLLFGNTAAIPGYDGAAINLDGNGDWVAIDSLASELKTGDDVTTACWFKTTAAKTNDQNNMIFSAHTAGKGNVSRIGTGNAGGIFYSAYAEDSEYGSGLNKGVWHHLVLVQHGSGSFEIYVDNSPLQSGTKSAVPWSTAIYYSIGQEWDTNPTDFFSGQIDDLRIYNYALSTAEIADLYIDTKPPELSGTVPADDAVEQSVSEIHITLLDRNGTIDHDATAAAFQVRDNAGQNIEGAVTVSGDVFIFDPLLFDNLPDDTYHVSLTAGDEAGNSAEYEFTFTVDGIAPAKPAVTGNIQPRPTLNTSGTRHITLNGTREDETEVWIKIVNDDAPVFVMDGLSLWVDASDRSTITETDGKVTQWRDKSGNNRHLTASGSVAPIYMPDIYHGEGVINFDSSHNKYFTFPRISNIRTVFWVVRQQSAGSYGSFLLGDSSSYHFTRGQNGEIWSSVWAHSSVKNGETRINGGAPVNGKTTVLPNNQFLTLSLITTGNVQANRFSKDRNFSRSWHGDISKLLIYNRPLSSSERSIVEDILMHGYNSGTARYVEMGSGDWSVNMSLSDGDNELEIWLTDRAGNPSEPELVDIQVDTTAPAIESVAPSHDSLLNAVPANFTVNFMEATSGLNMANTVKIIRDGNYDEVAGSWDLVDGNQLVFTPQNPFADSTYTVNIKLEDKLANQGPALEYRFTLDTTAPTAPVVNVVSTPTHNPTQRITGTKEAEAAILLNGQEIIAPTSATTWTYEVSLNNGSNLFTFVARDPAGNLSPATDVEIVFDDESPPAVATLSVDEQGDGTTVTLDWSGYDENAHGDVHHYEIYAEEAEFTDISGLTDRGSTPAGIFTFTVENLTRKKTAYFAVVAVDLAGNAFTTVSPVMGVPVDSIPPQDVDDLDVIRGTTSLTFTWEPSPDSDGDLAAYRVYFDGDPTGVSLESTQLEHRESGLTPATSYFFEVTAVDGDGNESPGVTITGITLRENPGGVVGEHGVITDLSHDEQTIYFTIAYQNPVVLAQPVSDNGGDPAVVRITRVQSDRFSFKVHEVPGTADGGAHAAETVSYFVFEAGDWQLPDGGLLKTGTLDTDTTVGARLAGDFEPVDLAPPYFTNIPVVFSQVQTNNDPHWVKTRLKNVGQTGFAVALEEEENKSTPHGSAETIGWLAVEAGSGDLDGAAYKAGLTSAEVNESWHEITFSGFSTVPGFLAAIETYNGSDNAGLRYRNLTDFVVEVMVEEDTTYDAETAHSSEVVGYLLAEGDGLLSLAPFEDTEPPELVSLDPADGSIVAVADQIVITLFDRHGSVDDDAVISSIEVLDESGDPVAGSVSEDNDQFVFTPTNRPMPDGDFNVSVSAVDMAANSAEYSGAFTLDGLAPATPAITGGTVNTGILQVRPFANRSSLAEVILSGTREDNSGVRINGVDAVAIGSGGWSVDLSLNQGDNALEITAVDAAGNLSPAVFVDIFVDSVAPTVTANAPLNGSFLSTAPVRITIELAEATSGLDFDSTDYAITDSGGDKVDGTWSYDGIDRISFIPTETFEDATYTVSIQLIDQMGNRGAAEAYAFTVDRLAPAAPQITGGSVASGVIRVAPAINESNVTGVTLEGMREANTGVWINGVLQVAVGSGDWSKSLNLSQGNNTLNISLKDRAGNQSDVQTVTILVDSVAPSITFISPADDSILNTRPERVVVGFAEATTSLDLDGSITRVLDNSFATVPGDWAIEGDSRFVFTPDSPFAESIYTVSLQLNDRLGNQGAVHQSKFTVDTIAPAAPNVDPVASPTVNPVQTISGTREAYTAVYMNGQQIIGNTAGTTWDKTVTLAGGSNFFTFAARDRADNESDAVVVEIVYDDVAPLPVDTLSVDGRGDGTRVTLDWSGYDESLHGDVATYRIYQQSADFSDVTLLAPIGSTPAGNFTFPLPGLSAGTSYYFAVVAVDQTGNFRTDVTTAVGSPADNAPPADVSNLKVQSFADRLIFTWSPSDSTDLARYRVCFEQESCIFLEGPNPDSSFEKTGLSSSSTFDLAVYARDTQGNESSGKHITGYTLLDNPSGLAAVAHSGKVELTWNAAIPAEHVKHYRVYASLNDFTSVQGQAAAVVTSSTGAQVAGLANNTTYYFAVTAVNLSDGERQTVTTVSAAPVVDSQGPQINDILIGSVALEPGYLVDNSATISLGAVDSAGVSRVEFSVDGSLIRTDYSGPDYTCHIDITDLADGAHTLTIAAFDTLGNITLETYSFSVDMALPAAPQITRPSDGSTVNRAQIAVSGSAPQNTTITLYNNDLVVVEDLAVDAQGDFSTTLTLAEGQNKLEAQAVNRSGPGAKSSAVYAILDITIPAAPTGLSAASLAGGKIRLTWQAPPDTPVSGYNLYRASQGFSDKIAAVKVNTSLIPGTARDNLPGSDGTWYYRVTARNAAGNESDLSEEAAAEADGTSPRAVAVQYHPQGNVNPATGAMAPGRLDILLSVSEPLQSDPFFTLTPEGGVPISVDLTRSAPRTYTGFITITADTPSARTWAVFSARDLAGNRGTIIDEGQNILIDTDGPAVSRLVVLPLSPIRNDDQDPAVLQVTAGLSEKSRSGSLIELGYLLPSQGGQQILIDNLSRIETQSGDAETWLGSITLPVDAGGDGVETLEFVYTAEDDLGNISHKIEGGNQFQVYQGDLPPLAVPGGLTGQALSGGRIKLSWNAVDGAVAYLLYRRGPAESELSEYARINGDLQYTDVPEEDGTYVYAVASIRSDNGQESASGMSAPVNALSDATAPPPPTGLALALISQGIRADWTASATAEPVTYAFYRAAAATTPVADATRVEHRFSQTFWIDFNPSPAEHYYMITAVDAVGNELAPCTPAYLDIALLPVSGITVVQQDFSLPVISWSHPEAVHVEGYDLYLGTVQDGTKLNTGLLTDRSFTDVGYSGDTRTYTLVAVSEGNDSLPRSLTLPELSAALDETVRLKRGIMNRLEFGVANSSSKAVGNIYLKVKVDGRNHTSDKFSLQAGESANIPVVVGGYDDLPDAANMVTTLEVKPNSGETVKIIRSSTIDVGDGILVLQILNEQFTRAASGKMRFVLQNTGDAEIEVVTARKSGKSASNQIKFYLVDKDDNVLTAKWFKQNVGANIVTLSNGNTVARIPAGESYTSDFLTMPVPAGAPDDVILRLEIANVYYHQGKSTQVAMKGLAGTHTITLADTSYYGAVTGISPQTTYGGEDIVIAGRALEQGTGNPLPNVPLKLVVTLRGFERTYNVYTDPDGSFAHTFKPLKGESGIYKVRAVHPARTDKPVHGQFTIKRVSVTPATINLSAPKNYTSKVNITVNTGQGTAVNNLRLEYDAADQPGGQYLPGVHLNIGGPKSYVGGQ